MLSSYFVDMLPIKFYTSLMETPKDSIKKQTGVRLDANLIKNLKHLSVDLDRSLTDILDEAVRDILKKYQKKGKKSLNIQSLD